MKLKIPYYERPHLPDGSDRNPGPIRKMLLNRTITATLDAAVNPEGRGGLRGRYRDELTAHLNEMADLRLQGQQQNVTVFWDIENLNIYKSYKERPLVVMDRVLRWLAGVLDAPVTRVEAVEFTRNSRTPQQHYLSGRCDWLMTLRQLGGVVHRAWPKMTDAADCIILDRMRTVLDEMQNGGPRRILCLLSSDKGFIPMLQAAQSEGATVVIMDADGGGRYYPGGSDFSVPLQMPIWGFLKMELMDERKDALRPEEEWTPDQGPRKWLPGLVNLVPAPEEELDRRRFHDFIEPGLFDTKPAAFDGSWVRRGLRLNDTVSAALSRALARTGTTGTRRGRLPEEASEALERDLADLSLTLEDSATVFWNFQDMKMLPAGPTQEQMLARVVRWLEGMLGMPVQRVEVAGFVEPWENLGSHAHDWLYSMQRLGMFIHRIWPPKQEMMERSIARSVGSTAKAADILRGSVEEDRAGAPSAPRLICVLSRQPFFEESIRDAQRAGVSVVWIGPEKRGFYYPANSDAMVRIDVLAWDTAMEELSRAVRDPFLPDVPTPDAPWAVVRKPMAPADPQWGRPEDLALDSGPPLFTRRDLQKLQA